MLKPSLYEKVINKKLDQALDQLTDKLKSTARIDAVEASKSKEYLFMMYI
ncbi:MAG: hypothetical protein ACOX6E_10505 [Syntrophomonadaceae bacterium]|jgi:hypothetical protein